MPPLTKPIYLSKLLQPAARMHLKALTKASILIGFLLCSACTWAAKPLTYEVLKTLPHNAQTFTQGLQVVGDQMIESSGIYGKSFLTSYNKNTGEQTFTLPLAREIFAEGLTQVDNTLFVLTWRENKLLRFNASTLAALPPLHYSGEGWGLTHTSNLFLMTDGSEYLYLRSKKDFSVVKKVKVHDKDKTYRFLNELEFAKGHLWLNVWQTSQILRVNYHTGEVTGILDLSALQQQNTANNRKAVLNGIAYDAEHDAYWVTGKLWPNRYLIRIATAPPPKAMPAPNQ